MTAVKDECVPVMRGTDITYERYNNKHLPSSLQLCYYGIFNHDIVFIAYRHIDFPSPYRRCVHEGKVSEVSHAHLEGAGDRGGREGKYVRATRHSL
jgi:hypothetical protein